MFLHVTGVSYIEAYRLRVEFSDGVIKEVNLSGELYCDKLTDHIIVADVIKEVNLSGELYGEVFEPLKDVTFFQQVSVNEETNTIEWPNGADFAPEFLYETGTEVKRVA